MKLRRVSVVVRNVTWCALVAFSCANFADAHEVHESDTQAVGMRGRAANVSRTINVAMSDSMRFIPANVNVMEGETIRFLVKNVGKVEHEFVLGDSHELEAHYQMMKNDPNMGHADPNMVSVAPGRSGQVIWHFTKVGTVEFACLNLGHFDAGMKGTVAVSPGKVRSSGTAGEKD